MSLERRLTPFMQTCVFLLQFVKLGLGADVGQNGELPSHLPSSAHSESFRHLASILLKLHVGVQQGPSLGLGGKVRFSIALLYRLHHSSLLPTQTMHHIHIVIYPE